MNPISVALLAVTLLPLVASAQTAPPSNVKTNIPVRELSAPQATSSDHYGTIMNVRPLADNKLLIDDGGKKQLIIVDAALRNKVILVDSASSVGQSYGDSPSPIIPYCGDSTLFVDPAALALVVITPSGEIARVMSAPKPTDLYLLGLGWSGSDAQGNIIYRGTQPRPQVEGTQLVQMIAGLQGPDSMPLVRANIAQRSVDTLARLKTSTTQRVDTSTESGRMMMTLFINPLTSVDGWAVLSDGALMIVRGHDYHVEIIRANGQKIVSPKLAFDWKQLTDADKQALIDSSRAAREKQDSAAKAEKRLPSSVQLQPGGGGTRVMTRGGPAASGIKFDYVPLTDIEDYWPPIRAGAVKADLDGNAWILPTTSAASKHGELVYDVVNSKGELFERVRMPAGRSIAGFGHNGIVYLMNKDDSGWTLERTKILN